MNILIKILVPALAVSFAAHAQKLPSEQQSGIAIPANSKIDGKTTEWNDQFEAYNKGTGLFYTIANDDKNIYLAVQATNSRVVQKLVQAGCNFLVNTPGKKDDYNGIIFPLITNPVARHALVDVSILPDVFSEPGAAPLAADTLLMRANKSMLENAKEIKIIGMPAVTDTIAGILTTRRTHFSRLSLFNEAGKYIPVENAYGIKAVAQFKPNGIITCEFAIPLKLIGVTEDAQKLKYKIVLNGLMDKTGRIAPGVMVREMVVNGAIVDPDADLNNPTNFEGEYTLKR